jgi:anti-sigma-K factor RskA
VSTTAITTPAPDQLNLPADAAGREAVAAEYVLGTLDQETSARIAAASETDPTWRAAVEAWETRLAPLTALAHPEQPPPDIWDRIEARITPHRPYVPRGPRISWLWKIWAIVATLAAAGIAAFAFLPALRMPGNTQLHLMGPLLPTAASRQPGFIIDVDPAGELRVQAFRGTIGGARPSPTAGRVLQLWGVLPGATEPVDLGVMPPDPTVVTIPLRVLQPVPDMLVQISLEPEGGSKVGRPTGPVIYVGRIVGVTTPN